MRRPLEGNELPVSATAQGACLEAVDVSCDSVGCGWASHELGEIELSAVATADGDGRPRTRIFTELHVAAHACPCDSALIAGNARRNAGFCVVLTNDVDHPGQRVGAVEHGPRAAHDFDALDIAQVREPVVADVR